MNLKKKILSLTLAFAVMATSMSMAALAQTEQENPQVPLTLADINKDGAINIKDALLALQHSVNLRALSEEQLALADVTGDDEVDVKDALFILRYSVQLVDTFPISSPYKVSFTQPALTIQPGDTASLTYTVRPAGTEILWSSSDDTVATVENGIITAHNEGSAIIKAVTVYGGTEAICNVTVGTQIPPVTSVTLNKTQLVLAAGKNEKLLAQISPEGTQSDILWSSDNPQIATVGSDGTVQAVSAGTAVITASAGEVWAQCSVEVYEQRTKIEDGIYTLKLQDTDLALSVAASPENIKDGTNVIVQPYTSSTAQQFRIINVSDSYISLYPVSYSAKALDVNRGSSMDNPLQIGQNIDLWQTNDPQAQQWFAGKQSDGSYVLKLGALNEGAMAAEEATDGANVFLAKYAYGENTQRWELERISDLPPADNIKLNVPLYKQTDSRWADIWIGQKPDGGTIGVIGCTTTCLAMTESYRTQTTVTPDKMAAQLTYSANGTLYWPSNYATNVSWSLDLQLIYDFLKQGQPVIIGGVGQTQHWVVIYGVENVPLDANGNAISLEKEMFLIKDPYNDFQNLAQYFNKHPNFKALRWYS